MKKALLLGAAVAAMSISSAASAIDVAAYSATRPNMVSDGLGILGVANFIVNLGPAGTNQCSYVLSWRDPQNPSNAVNCFLREYAGAANPSCNVNASAAGSPAATAVLAGPIAGTTCSGYDLTGNVFAGVSLICGETPGGGTGHLICTALIPSIPGGLPFTLTF